MHERESRGFTLVELAVVTAVILVLAAAAYASLANQRPRAELAATASDLHALVHGARLQAMASGRNVVVMLFPNLVTSEGTGRVIVYEDGSFDFFSTAAALNFDVYDPAKLAYAANSQVVTTLDLPRVVTVGPPTGMGAGVVLPAPYAGIDVTKACAFCSTSGDGRGAILFDPRGRAFFYSASGPPADVPGSSLSLAPAAVSGGRTLVITGATGSVRAFANG